MACIRRRRGTWVVDYRDSAGRRRWLTCETRRAAEDVLAERVKESRQTTRPAVDPDLTVSEYAERWLALIASAVKPRTLHSYGQTLRLHLLPTFGPSQVRHLHKGRIRAFLAEKLASGLKRNSVRVIHATLRAMLNSAGDDGVIVANPADKLGRHLRLTSSASDRQKDIKAFNREQLARFLGATLEARPRYYPLFFTLARTGLRIGEAFALRWEDLDLANREIRIERALSAGRIETPKSGKSRTIDMSLALKDTLARLDVLRKQSALAEGREPAELVFGASNGAPLDQSRTSKAFKGALKAAGLPLHYSPHSLRHTFASLLLQQGESPVYVQRQLGHASIQLTVDCYGGWLPHGNKAAVDRLDEAPKANEMPLAVASGSKTVAAPAASVLRSAQVVDLIWSRRTDLNRGPADYESAALPLSYAGLGGGTATEETEVYQTREDPEEPRGLARVGKIPAMKHFPILGLLGVSVLVLFQACGGDSPVAPAAVATTTIPPTTTTLLVLGQGRACGASSMPECGATGGSPGGDPPGVYGCCTKEGTANGSWDAEVWDAINIVQREQPSLFNNQQVLDRVKYLEEVAKAVEKKYGLCVKPGFPGDEVGVKTQNGFSEQYDIYESNGRVRYPGYQVTCRPARF